MWARREGSGPSTPRRPARPEPASPENQTKRREAERHSPDRSQAFQRKAPFESTQQPRAVVDALQGGIGRNLWPQAVQRRGGLAAHSTPHYSRKGTVL